SLLSYRITKKPFRANSSQNSSSHHSMEAVAPIINRIAGLEMFPIFSVQRITPFLSTTFSFMLPGLFHFSLKNVSFSRKVFFKTWFQLNSDISVFFKNYELRFQHLSQGKSSKLS